MSLNDRFCPSPWLHMRINSIGDFYYCRWANDKQHRTNHNIATSSPITWFQKNMSPVRQAMLEGIDVESCSPCWTMEKHNKISGRERQLLKIGVTLKDFEKSMLSSPWLSEFNATGKLSGDTAQVPRDWQIDLGNHCNSACIFCGPSQSSRLATEFKKLKLINELPPKSWCDDMANIEKFIDTLIGSPDVAYLHFIGGETLITPGFRKILQSLIKHDINKTISLGFTTNLTVWDQDIVDMLVQFKEINLGMSIECIHPLNDYVRYGSDIRDVVTIMEKWIELGKKHQWLLQLRVTPSVFSIYYLDTIYSYAVKHAISVESCNFLEKPIFMKPSVLPMQYRIIVIQRLQEFLDQNSGIDQSTVINIRHQDWSQQQAIQDAQSYVNYLRHEPDESHQLPELVKFIKLLESSRNNKILDYLPDYEDFLRSSGY